MPLANPSAPNGATPQGAAPSAPASSTTPAAPAAPASSSTPAPGAATTPQGGAPAAGTTQDPAAGGEPKDFSRLAVAHRKLEKELKALKDEHGAGAADRELIAALRDKDPAKRYAAAEKLGLKYDEWTMRRLEDAGHEIPKEEQIDLSKLPPELVSKLQLVDELIAERDKAKTAETVAEAKRRNDESVAYVRDKLVGENKEKYPLIAALGLYGAVVHEYTTQRDKDEGLDPNEHEMAARVEQKLEAEIRKNLTALLATAKGKALIAELSKTSASPQASNGQNGRGKPPAVNNDLSAEPGDGVDKSKLTAEQKRERAIAAMRRA